MKDRPKPLDEDICLLRAMRRVVECIILLRVDLDPNHPVPITYTRATPARTDDRLVAQRQINAAAAALRRLALVMLNSEPLPDLRLKPASRPQIIRTMTRRRSVEGLDASDFLVALGYFNAAFKYYAYVYYHPDLIDLRPCAALARQERMERLMERELLAAIVELEKTRQMIAAFTPTASTAS
jgi:hypothetical protein